MLEVIVKTSLRTQIHLGRVGSCLFSTSCTVKSFVAWKLLVKPVGRPLSLPLAAMLCTRVPPTMSGRHQAEQYERWRNVSMKITLFFQFFCDHILRSFIPKEIEAAEKEPTSHVEAASYNTSSPQKSTMQSSYHKTVRFPIDTNFHIIKIYIYIYIIYAYLNTDIIMN